MRKILVTGANGQLGQCIMDEASNYPAYSFVFATRKDLDITHFEEVKDFFGKHSFAYCINAAAYTNVEKAESDSDAAFLLNAEAVKNLSEVCNENDTTLVHISTDYVFDGEATIPYKETDHTNPINVYGASKLKGEAYVTNICKKQFVLRTSWLYSQYGHNFLNTILKYAKEGKALTITTEQSGTPTNANDLAKIILKIVSEGHQEYGLYHFSNNGKATWYDFAHAILSYTHQLEKTNLAKTDHYRTFAKRPKNSVMDLSLIKEKLNIEIEHWTTSLKSLLIDKIIN